jgi:hypothetical protein
VVSVIPSIKSLDQASAPQPLVKPERGGGYALSEHVMRYYNTARV